MSSPHRLRHDLYMAPAVIKDPGEAGTITIDKYGGVCSVDTTPGGNRFLRRPTKAGILGTVVLGVDAGNLTLGVVGGYNFDSATSITFGDAGDFVTLISIEYGGVYCWRVLGHEGTNIAAEDLTTDQLTAVTAAITTLSIGGTAITATAAEINIACDLSVQRLTGGTGFTSGVGGFYETAIEQIGSLYKTTIFMDLTGLGSSTTDLDIIGTGALAAHFGQITAAKCGELFYGQITCLEAPATAVTDIDFYSAESGAGVFDGGIAALTGTEVALRTHGGAWSAAPQTPIALTAVPAADTYLYAVCGAAGTPQVYTAGQFLIELWGR